MPRDLLIEIGCEDLPARYVMPLAEALRSGIVGGLDKRGVAHGAARLFATPRRIAVWIAAIAETQPAQMLDLTGPALNVAFKDGQPTPAALGFAKKCGVEFSALGQKDGKLHYVRSEAGKATVELIPTIFEDSLKGMDELVPKRMRWGNGSETFVRPVSWLVALFGDDVVSLSRFGLHSGRLTYGHRFHAPGVITLTMPAGYPAALKAAHVWAEVDSRKAEIRRQIEAKARALGGHARITEDLLDEVTALVEWPIVIAGAMEQRFTDELPYEVIVATVETNQRYFTVFADAALTRITPHFITIANIESRDVAQVVEGNERVVRPRLSDALFFWEQDRRQPLAGYRTKLESATYQKELGSIDQRVQRIEKLARALAAEIGADATITGRAAALCKNDLVTKMVFEFPELQGVMGGYYASKSGEPAAVAQAIREHYLPVQQGTPIPSTEEGRILSLADKLDQLAGIFAIGQKPTASKDPFALRRAANGVLRICIEGALPLDVAALLRSALALQPAGKHDDTTLAELVEFVLERLRALLVGGDVNTDMFEAVKATGTTTPLDFARRLKALEGFVKLPASANLTAAHKRIRNILKQTGTAGTAVHESYFEHEAERTLFAAMNALKLDGDYAQALSALATLREPVDTFFAAVMVNADDAAVRANRLALLARLDGLCRSVADISLLPG
jgi:glycyl-tRNA synthetase beta chain